ncbi:MAG TPA: GTPase Era [Pyrinomonadaceae bacterium]|jgi:GTP-binding protein Era|nr:GTPase Era [Pyrinomonadaceae bacterium]
MDKTNNFKSGFVAMIGRPNAGKSTLLNCLVGEKIAAVSNKPQTTRIKIKGIVSRPEGQIVFLDTPGVHKPGYLLNRRMMAAVEDSVSNSDIVMLVRDASVSTGNGDRFVLESVKSSGKKSILVLNKIDKISNKNELLPLIEFYSKNHDFAEIVPISAKKGESMNLLVDLILKHLPEGEPLFDEDEITDLSMRTIAAEIVREKILASTGEEIPFATAVVVDKWDEGESGIVEIYCQILVEKNSQKPIIIGRGGQRLKEVGTLARLDLEKLLDKHVKLHLFVKVEENWRNKEKKLDELGVIAG